tara:strand:+ start:5765 stop:6688 length:924 start_codon:yes stop_codon:yes gene_type:complete
MKILYFERHHSNSYSYYNEIKNALARDNTIYQYTKWTPVGGEDLNIGNVLSECPEKPDFILFGFGWTDCSENYPKKVRDLDNCKIPVGVILNKEYAALEKKLDWIKNMSPQAAFTVLHEYDDYSKRTNVPFHQIPFAVNPSVFKKYAGEKYNCDFGFSGVIRPEQRNNWRHKIIEDSKSWQDIKTSFSQHRHDTMEAYARRINRTKIWLSTTGPADIVNPRYFEVMAANTTLLICNRLDHVYKGLFEEDVHCVMFETLEELRDKVEYYLNNDHARQKIINQAYEHAISKHTWAHRADKINSILKEIT